MLFLVNDALGLKPDQTTTMLVRAAARGGRPVYVMSADAITLSASGRVEALARRVQPCASTLELVEHLAGNPAESVGVEDFDVVMIRTNPGRDGRVWAHNTALNLLRRVRDAGVQVLSDPEGLARASSKLYLAEFPQHLTPRTLVTRDGDRMRAFLAAVDGPCVLKPLDGTHGRDVFKVDPHSTENLNQIFDVLTRQGYVMAQEYVPEASEGDVRMLLLRGELLEVDGRVAAVRRVPGGTDFRSNVSAGGRATAVTITPALRRLAQEVGPLLRRDGIFMAGLDVIGHKIVEINVFSPGGFQDAEVFEGVDFSRHVMDEVLRLTEATRSP